MFPLTNNLDTLYKTAYTVDELSFFSSLEEEALKTFYAHQKVEVAGEKKNFVTILDRLARSFEAFNLLNSVEKRRFKTNITRLWQYMPTEFDVNYYSTRIVLTAGVGHGNVEFMDAFTFAVSAQKIQRVYTNPAPTPTIWQPPRDEQISDPAYSPSRSQRK